MIIRGLIVTYLCKQCDKSRIVSMFGLYEHIDRVYDRHIKSLDGALCDTCRKSKLIIKSVQLKTTQDARARWRIDWHCNDCTRTWAQHRYLSQRSAFSSDFAFRAKSQTMCTCANKNRDFFIVRIAKSEYKSV